MSFFFVTLLETLCIPLAAQVPCSSSSVSLIIYWSHFLFQTTHLRYHPLLLYFLSSVSDQSVFFCVFLILALLFPNDAVGLAVLIDLNSLCLRLNEMLFFLAWTK